MYPQWQQQDENRNESLYKWDTFLLWLSKCDSVVCFLSQQHLEMLEGSGVRKLLRGKFQKLKKEGEIYIAVPCTIMFKFLSISTTSTKLHYKIFLAIQATADFEQQLLMFPISLQSVYSRSLLSYRCECWFSAYELLSSLSSHRRLQEHGCITFCPSASEKSIFQ